MYVCGGVYHPGQNSIITLPIGYVPCTDWLHQCLDDDNISVALQIAPDFKDHE